MIKSIGVSIALTIVAIGMTTEVIVPNTERSTMEHNMTNEERLPMAPGDRDDLIRALLTAPTQREASGSMTLFSGLIGSWKWNGFDYTESGRIPTKGKWIFETVLNGNAVQDVFIFDHADSAANETKFLEYGTTIRFPNADGNTWTAVWISPLNKTVRTFTAKLENDEIVMEGKNDNHRPIRWIFSNLRVDRFHWRGELYDDRRWVLYEELEARRVVSNHDP